jgi:Rieske Fe-S protein
MPLRLVPEPPVARDCSGCSRRTVLQGLAMTAASVLVGCQAEDNGPASDAAPDAGGPASDGGGPIVDARPKPVCPTGSLCLDLDDPANTKLTAVDGSLVVTASSAIKLIVVRISATAFEVVSDICTHAGCGVAYDKVDKILKCPCHGSQYKVTGEVLMPPAVQALKRYTARFDAASNTLTIAL